MRPRGITLRSKYRRVGVPLAADASAAGDATMTVDAHSAALLEALKDPSELWNMGERGRRTLGTRTYEAQAEEYLSLFRRGLSSTI